jgi:hypothetical protein
MTLFFPLGVGGWDWVHLIQWPLFGLFYQPGMIDDGYRAVSGMRIGRENWSTRRKPAPVALCPLQTPTSTDLGSNLGHLGGKLVTNCLSYSTAFNCEYWGHSELMINKLKLSREIEVYGEHLYRCHFVHHKSQKMWPGVKPGWAH